MGSDSRKIVKIFLASPGDMKKERKIVRDVVNEYNDLWADMHGYQVELVGWEDTVSSAGRPQAIINQDLEQCEYFIGMVWQRWGTPPSKGGKFSSGFEEEFETSLERWKKSKRPEISLFLKDIEDDQLNDIGPQLKKVLKFREKIISKKSVLFETFNENDLDHFMFRIKVCITRYIQKLMKEEEEQGAQTGNAPLNTEKGNSSTEAKGGLPKEALSFLQDFTVNIDASASTTPMAEIDIARLRLLACMLSASGNDTQTLGIHDANILFKERENLLLSHAENLALVSAGLEQYQSEVVPLWYWLEKSKSLDNHWLTLKSTFGEDSQKIGALKALRFISESLSPTHGDGRDFYLNVWFSPDASDSLKNAAFGYLSECGVQYDLAVIKNEIDRGDYQTKNEALEAYIRILLRDSRDKALSALVELQPETISANLIDAVFCFGEAIEEKILQEAVKHRHSEVRYHSIKSLAKRHLLSKETAISFLSDENAKTRYTALCALEDLGISYPDAEAKKILIKPKPISPPSAFGFTRTSPDTEGQKIWDDFYRNRLRSRTTKELLEIEKRSIISDYSARFVLHERTLNKKDDQLRATLRNHFEIDYAHKLEQLRVQYPDSGDKLVEDWKSVEETVRKSATREGLDIICKAGKPSDLSLVREILGSGFVDYSELDFEYFEKNGEWKDIPLVSALVAKSRGQGTGLMQFYHLPEEYARPAHVIYKLGQSRLSELLFLDLPKEILERLILICTDKNFSKLGDPTIIKLFGFEHDKVRKATALKCIRALPKKRLAELFDGYKSSGLRQFYNVIHWLDFGISLPRDRARESVAKLIKREWSL